MFQYGLVLFSLIMAAACYWGYRKDFIPGFTTVLWLVAAVVNFGIALL